MDQKIAADLKMRLDNTRLQVVKSLGIPARLFENSIHCGYGLDSALLSYYLSMILTNTFIHY